MTDTVIIDDRFKLRRYATRAGAVALNEILYRGEEGFEEDTGCSKIGDGTSHYNDLKYSRTGFADLSGLADGYVKKWDAASGLWIVGTAGASYTPGTGIDISGSNVISSTLGSIALSGYPDDYASLPSGLGSGDAGEAYMTKDTALVYIWNGSAFPDESDGIDISGRLAFAYASSPTSRSTSSTGIPYSGSVPTITQGSALSDYNISITPKRADTVLIATLMISYATSSSSVGVRFSAFRDGGTNAVFACSPYLVGDASRLVSAMQFIVPSNAKVATSFTFRFGVSTGSVTINQAYGSAGYSYISIEEKLMS